jgi:hypothetical protein
MDFHHGVADEPNTHISGSKRIDYALGTHHVASSISKCGYDPFKFRTHSDHRGMYFDFDTTRLFGSNTPAMPKLPNRGVQATDPRSVRKYVAEKAKYFRDHNVGTRLRQLNECQDTNHELAEGIDRDNVRGSRHAEKSCQHQGDSPWSPAFAKAHARVYLYKTALTMARTNVDMRGPIREIKRRYQLTDNPPLAITASRNPSRTSHCGLGELVKQNLKNIL